MGKLQKLLLTVFLVVILIVIITTWGSIGSAVLTLALLLAGVYILLVKVMENRDPDDFDWNG